jgi:uncharacterized protein (DUF1800 family)
MSRDPRLQHLLRRAGFGATAAELDRYSRGSLASVVDELIQFDRVADDVDARFSSGEGVSPSTAINDARQRWLFRMVQSRRPLQEKMALFWHSHFPTAYSKIAGRVGAPEATRMVAATRSEHPAGGRGQLELFREYAVANFRDMLVEVAKDPAMLVWLDGRSNTKARPQENFSREIMELFTIGVGQFVEADVYAGARVFTGWNLRRVGGADDPASYYEFFYNAAQHDTAAKEFSFPIYNDGAGSGGSRTSRTIPARTASGGMQDGIDLIAALTRHPATGRRLARRLWAFFVSEIEAPSAAFVEQIARVYQQSDCHMAPTVRAVLSSREFNAGSSYFARYSWPVEYVARALKEVGYGSYPLSSALSPLANMGQQLFEPPDVGGWSLGTSWFSTATMLARMNFAASLVGRQRGDIARAASGKGPTPEALLSFYLDRVTPADFDSSPHQDLLAYLRAGGEWTGSDAQLRVKAPGLLHLIIGSAEYQLI